MAEELSITTAVKRRSIKIDGAALELLNQDELSLAATVRAGVVLDSFREKARLSEDGAKAMSESLAKSVRDVLPGLKKDIDDKLSDTQRIDIMFAFFRATPEPAASAASESPVQS